MRRGMRVTWLAFAVTCVLNMPALAQSSNEAGAWLQIKDSPSADQLKAFLNSFPKGAFASEARQKLSLVADEVLPAEVRDISIRFPAEARRLGHSIGPMRVVTLAIQVRADGTASGVDIAKSSGFDLYDKAAVAAARSATYLPSIDHGAPVASRLDYDVSFGLVCNRAAGSPPDCYGGRFPASCSATVCSSLRR